MFSPIPSHISLLRQVLSNLAIGEQNAYQVQMGTSLRCRVVPTVPIVVVTTIIFITVVVHVIPGHIHYPPSPLDNRKCNWTIWKA
jgi:hypothetical protein